MQYESLPNGMDLFNATYGHAAVPLLECLKLQYEAATKKAPDTWAVRRYENGLVLLSAQADDQAQQRQLDRLDCGSMFMKAAANVYSGLSEHEEESETLEALQLAVERASEIPTRGGSVNKQHHEASGLIEVGPLAFTHNRLLLVLASLAALAMAIASYLSPIISPASKALEPQLLWAYQLLLIGAGGAVLFHRAGFKASSRNCLLVAGGVLVGAALKAFLA
ncbi:hypothetical protein ACSVIJ_04700 [Pseudomonas sp. NCHU5208]|uniref:hypothetical protein n=1 Tax=unclassified Pseudomonas TaxID=196821 RepID=UPI003F96635C